MRALGDFGVARGSNIVELFANYIDVVCPQWVVDVEVTSVEVDHNHTMYVSFELICVTIGGDESREFDGFSVIFPESEMYDTFE